MNQYDNPAEVDRLAREQRVRMSRYRQVRLTFTQEMNGRCSVSLYAKGLNEAWNEPHCLERWSYDSWGHPLVTTEDVLHVLIGILQERTLPGVP